jgi:peptidylprolyl isomerase
LRGAGNYANLRAMKTASHSLVAVLALLFVACESQPAPSTPKPDQKPLTTLTPTSQPSGGVNLPPAPRTTTGDVAQPASQGNMSAAPPPPKPTLPGALPAPPDVAAPPADTEKLPSGLASKVLQKGTGKVKPKAEETVKVNYSGWTTDGNMFDSSVARNRPATFPLNRVIPGWTQGVALMVVGEKRRMWIPEELAYKGQPGRPQGMLVFDVELLEILKAPEAPKDVKAPPKDAKKTASGLAYKVLTKGKGTKKPTPASRVQVHYTGWTTDGKSFDSSVMRGQPAMFPVGRVIPGWTEGLQLMVEGDKFRFWIPEDLAYKNRPGPQGMLVFDVELISIQEGMPGMPGMGGMPPRRTP